jgi:stearoyl-CoA desaturase (Delta-9 desaturase)
LFVQVPQPDRYGSWLRNDPLVVWVDRTWVVWVALGLLLPFALGGWSDLLWGGLVRIFLLHHVTWSVNSICHTFGSRPFNTKDASRNNGLIGLLALGEGWHNNHHAFPKAAFHGMRWWQFDLSAYLIRALETVGLAWSIHRVAREDARKRASGTGGLRHDAGSKDAETTW